MNALRIVAPLMLFAVACDAIPEDPLVVRERYRGHYGGPCNAWAISTQSGREYCASPSVGFTTDPAFAAAITKVDDAAFVGFDTKTPEEKQVLLMSEGKAAYTNNCQSCHGADATGNGTLYPALANDPLVNGGSVDEHLATVLKGLSGKVIGGVAYTGAMTPFGHLTDNQLAAIVTYERNSWGNVGGVVEPAAVKAARAN
ncbi:MAG: c-type cytochrome [Myxococcales bacterium]|nr:c-type cytochrome [Myxococcales bacterium]